MYAYPHNFWWSFRQKLQFLYQISGNVTFNSHFNCYCCHWKCYILPKYTNIIKISMSYILHINTFSAFFKNMLLFHEMKTKIFFIKIRMHIWHMQTWSIIYITYNNSLSFLYNLFNLRKIIKLDFLKKYFVGRVLFYFVPHSQNSRSYGHNFNLYLLKINGFTIPYYGFLKFFFIFMLPPWQCNFCNFR